jgi:DNA-binding response OmpR family regulator/thioredoxin-like negative regulator of GroEL
MRDERFQNKQGKVLIANKSSSTRGLYQEALRTMGFTVEGCDAPKDVLGRLEVDELDWVIIPLAKDEEVNGMHVLDVLSRVRERLNVRVSLILEEDEKKFLPIAFELGLLCSFSSGGSKDFVNKELKQAFERLEKYKFDTTLFSASLLRDMMIANSKHQELYEFCHHLFDIYPSDETVLVWLAESAFLSGKREIGQKLVAQLKALNIASWEPLSKKYLAEDGKLIPELGITKVMIVDPDEAVQKSMRDLLTRCAVSDVKCFGNGLEAFEALQKDPPDLLITEWKIPELSGLNLLQRIRHENNHALPVIVFSSLLTKADAPIVSEMSVANIVEKPFREQDMLHALVWTLQQEKCPTQVRSQERKMYQHLLLGHRDKAIAIKNTIESSSDYPEGSRFYNEGLFAFYSGKYDVARNALIKASQAGTEQLKVISLLGKCFLKLRNFRDATACLQRANELAPRNMERMCILAESHAEMGNTSAAAELIDKASAQDAGAANVKVAASKVALHAGNSKKAAKLFAGMSGLTFLVADLNNSAVAHIREGDYKRGLDLYAQTLEALPPSEEGLRVRIKYNLALAYARKKDLETSKEILDEIPQDFMAPVMAKVHQFRKKLERAISQERDFEFDKTDDIPQTKEVHETAVQLDLETERIREHIMLAQPGNRCLHLIFRCPSCVKAETSDLLKAPPRFALRSSIQREEGFGIEKAR